MDFLKINEKLRMSASIPNDETEGEIVIYDSLAANKLNRDIDVASVVMTVSEAREMLLQEIDIDPLIERANNHTISDAVDAQQALSMSLQARKIKKSLDKTRLELVRPHVNFQRSINKIVKDYTSKLEEIEKSLKVSIDDWVSSNSGTDLNYSDLVMEVSDGKLTKKSEWVFEVEDESDIPREYLLVDEKKIKSMIKSGIRSIPGIKIFEKTNTSMRVTNG